MRADLVLANHILADTGVVDAFGHVSVRTGADRFLMTRSMAPALAAGADLLEFDLDGQETSGDPRPGYLERFIHSEIYRARPDVAAVVHAHSPSVVPFSVVAAAPLRPVIHLAGFVGPEAPVHDVATVVGDGSDLLVRDARLGASLASRLGGGAVVLQRGHGFTTAAASVRQAVFQAVYLEQNARVLAAAHALGPVTTLTEDEARAAAATSEAQAGRAWALWALHVEHARSRAEGRDGA